MPGQLSLFKGKKQRGTKPPPPLEFDTHCMVADVLRRWQTPGWRWSHFPAGEYRPWPTRMRLARMGTQPGWADFVLLAPAGGGAHFLELKRKGGKLSPYQRAFAAFCEANGYPFACCDSLTDAIVQLQQWGALRASVSA